MTDCDAHDGDRELWDNYEAVKSELDEVVEAWRRVQSGEIAQADFDRMMADNFGRKPTR